jgi:hypothetical protein
MSAHLKDEPSALFWVGAIFSGIGFLILNWRAWQNKLGFIDPSRMPETGNGKNGQ